MNDTHQPDEPSDTPTEESITEDNSAENEDLEFAAGSWIRLVFTDDQGQKEIETVFVPDNPEKTTQKTINDYDQENTNNWIQLLGNPPGVNVNNGIAILRLDEEAEIVTTTWISSAKGIDIVRHTLEQESGVTGIPTASASQFRECLNNQPADMRFGDKLNSCLNQLFL